MGLEVECGEGEDKDVRGRSEIEEGVKGEKETEGECKCEYVGCGLAE